MGSSVEDRSGFVAVPREPEDFEDQVLRCDFTETVDSQHFIDLKFDIIKELASLEQMISILCQIRKIKLNG